VVKDARVQLGQHVFLSFFMLLSPFKYHFKGLGNQHRHSFSLSMYSELRAIIIDLSHRRYTGPGTLNAVTALDNNPAV